MKKSIFSLNKKELKQTPYGRKFSIISICVIVMSLFIIIDEKKQ